MDHILAFEPAEMDQVTKCAALLRSQWLDN